MREESYFPICPKYNKRTQVDVAYHEITNRKKQVIGYNWIGGRCHLFTDHPCCMVDYPCVPHDPL